MTFVLQSSENHTERGFGQNSLKRHGIKSAVLTLLLSAFCLTAFAQRTDKEWQAEAIAKYPALGIQGSELNKKFLNAYAERRKTAPDFFSDPKWSMRLADELAPALAAAIPIETPQRTPQPVSQPPVPLPSESRPASSLPPPVANEPDKSQPIRNVPPSDADEPEQITSSTTESAIQRAPLKKSSLPLVILVVAIVAAVGIILWAVAANTTGRDREPPVQCSSLSPRDYQLTSIPPAAQKRKKTAEDYVADGITATAKVGWKVTKKVAPFFGRVAAKLIGRAGKAAIDSPVGKAAINATIKAPPAEQARGCLYVIGKLLGL